MLLTWIVNRDREPLVGGATRRPSSGRNTFPYLAPPNTELQTVAESMVVNAPADKVWDADRPVRRHVASVDCADPLDRYRRSGNCARSRPSTARPSSSGSTRPTTRQRQYRYSGVTGMGASNYTGVLEVAPKGSGSSVTWRVQYLSDGQPTIIIRTIVATLQKVGLESLKKRFG